MEMLGERVRKARLGKGMSQRELGERVGLTQAAICQFERGQRYPTPRNLRKISRILNLDVAELAGEDPGGFERAVLMRNLKGLTPEAISRINEMVVTFRQAQGKPMTRP